MLNGKDALLLLILALLTLGAVFANYRPDAHPFEDAAMLMRYARHLAQGHGIVWNIGERPVDGGTDFLLICLLAVLARGGMAVESAALLTNTAAHVATVLLLYLGNRRLHGAGRLPAAFSALYLALGPAIGYIASYFGTSVFAFFVCCAWYGAVAAAREPAAPFPPLAFALLALLMGLTRPEGVLLAGFMLLALLYRLGLRRARPYLLAFAAVFALLGGAYFLWRWSYFGHPLPNPFYKKGRFQLHFDALGSSIRNVFALALPFAGAYILGLRSSETRRWTLFALIPLVGFTLIWVLLSDEMNYLRRFQYAVLPIVLLSWYPLVEDIPREWNLPAFRGRYQWGYGLLLALLLLGVLWRSKSSYWVNIRHDGRYDVAVLLKEYRDKGYVLATTEAGLLPFYSGWRSVDAWGLNDAWIAWRGGITEAYLDRYRPHVIMFLAPFSPIKPYEGGGRDRWAAMVFTLKAYAEKNGYKLAASFGETPTITHYYWVRRDFPDSDEITERIRTTRYHWFRTGRRCTDYAREERGNRG